MSIRNPLAIHPKQAADIILTYKKVDSCGDVRNYIATYLPMNDHALLLKCSKLHSYTTNVLV